MFAGKKIGPDPRNFNQRVSLGRNDLLIRTFLSCAQAAETAKQWEFNIGAMYEIENVEGQGDDKDGLYEPSVWFNATWDAGQFLWRCIRKGPLITAA